MSTLAKPLLSVNISNFFDPIWVDKKAVAVVLLCADCFDGGPWCSSRAWYIGHRIWVYDGLHLPLPPAHDGGQGDAGHEEEGHQADQEGEDDVRGPGGGGPQLRVSGSSFNEDRLVMTWRVMMMMTDLVWVRSWCQMSLPGRRDRWSLCRAGVVTPALMRSQRNFGPRGCSSWNCSPPAHLQYWELITNFSQVSN